ncbi:MAG: diphosphomevalonate decarboxylase, partial [Candidatus Binatia bacterium]
MKYWGKADPVTNHPAGASISVTLQGLSTAARVSFEDGLRSDRVDGLPAAPARRVVEFLASFRARFGIDRPARAAVASNFPVAAGLASSASTFAALAKAAVSAAGLDVTNAELASVARLGSGSACRSVFGGFVEWLPAETGSAVAPLAPENHWPLAIVVAVTSESPKAVGSREGMTRTAATSPYYRAWLDSGAVDFAAARGAILARDLSSLGPVVERNCLRMHAAAMAADPPLLYWEPATVAVMRRVSDLRAGGLE